VDIGVALGAVDAELDGWCTGTSTWPTPSQPQAGCGWLTSRPLAPSRVPTTWLRRCWSVPGTAIFSESAAARLWACAAGMDRREFAVCAGSVGLTMTESFQRHGRSGEATGEVPGMVQALEQALALAGA